MVWFAPSWGSGCATFQVNGLPPKKIRMGMRSNTKIMRTITGLSLFFSGVFSIGVE